MEFIEKEFNGEIIKLPKIKEGDIVSLCFEDREDLDLAEFLSDFKSNLIVEGVEYETGLFWIKDCDYAINIAWIIDVDSSIATENSFTDEDIWIITAFNNYSYSSSEMHTKWANTYNKALYHFKSFIDNYIAAEKEHFVGKFNVEDNLSLSQYVDIAFSYNEDVSYGYQESKNEKIFTINRICNNSGDTEEFIIRMFKLNSEVNNFTTIDTLEHDSNIDNILNKIKCFKGDI